MPLQRLRRVHIFPVAACIVLSLILSLPAVAAYKLTAQELKEVMPLSEVRVGMKGYGLTVFRGTTIEKFDVTVVGIMPKVNMGGSWILAKLDGGPMTERHANVISGMSGSPVYVNGRIIGAVGYGGKFSTEPMAMITPIEDMLDSWDPDLPTRPSGHSSLEGSGSLEIPLSIGGRTINRVIIQEPNESQMPSIPDALIMTPLSRISVSGLSSRGIRKLADMLSPYGVGVTAGPGSGALQSRPKVDLEPGAAVGMSLATGDIDMTGIGTVTYRSGNKIVAFGHPFFGIGAIDAPMTTAYVHDVLPSLMVSEKLASPIETVGRISQDRPFSIGGEVGKMPEMIPVTVNVKDLSTKRNKTFSVKALNHPLLAPLLIPVIVGESIYQTHPTPGEATASISFEVEADQIGSIKKDNIVFDPVAVDGAALSDLAELLFTLKNNRIRPIDVKAVNMTVEITAERNTAVIERIFVEKGKYEPGETVDVGVVLKPYKKDRVTKRIQIAIPPTTPNGRISLSVRGGASSGMPMVIISSAQGPDPDGEEGPPSRPQQGFGSDPYAADNVHQLVKKYLEKERNNEIVSRLMLPSSSIEIFGEKMPFLPPHISSVMRSSKTTALRTQRDEVKVSVPTEYVLTGAQTLVINVQKKDLSEKKGPAKPDQSPSSPPTSGPSAPISPEAIMSSMGAGFMDEDMDAWDYDDGFQDVADLDQESTPLADTPQQARPQSPPPGLARLLAARAVAVSSGPSRAASESGSASSSRPEGKPVGRAAAVWSQRLQQEFASGFLVGVSPTSANDLRLSQLLERVADTTETLVWSLAPDGNGGIYAGTGHSGRLMRVSATGEVTTVFDSPELQVFSVVKDADGNLYLGTSPNGLVYSVTPQGETRKALDVEEKHIVALAKDSKGNIYAASGDKSRVYKVAPDGSAVLHFESSDSSAQALAIDQSDNLYVGGASNGVIYKVTPDGLSTAIYDSPESSIVSIAVDDSGNIYAGTASKPTVVKIPPKGSPKTLVDKAASPIMALQLDSEGNVYAAAQDRIYRIQPDEIVTEIDTIEDVQFTAMCLADSGRLFVGTSNTGLIYAASDKVPIAGSYESVAHDAKVSSTWGTIAWTAKTPEGTKVEVSTRTGNTVQPDTTWSAWSQVYENAEGSRIVSPAARYIQYRATLSSDKSGVTPALQAVDVVYMQANQPPVVKIASPSGGERWSKKQMIKWTGSDPDKDVLTYDIYCSRDDGFTWRPLKKDAKAASSEPSNPRSETSKAKPDSEEDIPVDDEESDEAPELDVEVIDEITEETVAEIIADISSDSGIPQSIRDKALLELTALQNGKSENGATNKTDAKKEADTAQPDAKAEAKPEAKPDSEKSESTKQTSYQWDTKDVPDGAYLIKVVVSDKTSNATGALAAEKISGPIVIVNKPPKAMVFKKSISVEMDKTVKIEGVATQNLVPISNAQYRIGTGDWTAVAAADGIFDTNLELFALVTPVLAKGEHTIEVKVFDAAGNSASDKAKVKIE